MPNENAATFENCKFRKWLAKKVDMHIDWRDCWREDCEYKKLKEGADNG